MLLRICYAALIVIFLSCTKHRIASTVSDANVSTVNDAARFRAAFMTAAKSDELKGAERYLYGSDADFRGVQTETGDFDALREKIKKRLQNVLPSELMAHAQAMTMPALSFESEAVPTFVVLPGVLGEFIEESPFDSLFLSESVASSIWKKNFAAGSVSDKQDLVHSIRSGKEELHSMDELVRVASLDSKDGKEKLRVVFLKPLFGSFETISTIPANADIAVRRIDKLFHIMGEPAGPLFLFGYSRGLLTALEIANRVGATAEKSSWRKALTGVISYAGSPFGDALADDALSVSSDSNTAKIIRTLKDLGTSLEDGDDSAPLLKKLPIIQRNTGRWLAAFKSFSSLQADPDIVARLKAEGVDSSNVGTSSFIWFVRKALFESFDLSHPVGNYFLNIRHLKEFIQSLLDGMKSLSTQERRLWWAQAHLPAHYNYIAVAATMPDATKATASPTDLTRQNSADFIHSFDYAFLRSSFYDLLLKTGVEANDSQVSIDESGFWPGLMQFFKQDIPEENLHFLGVLGGSHWGIAFPRAFEAKSKAEDIFPRKTALRAMGLYVSTLPKL